MGDLVLSEGSNITLNKSDESKSGESDFNSVSTINSKLNKLRNSVDNVAKELPKETADELLEDLEIFVKEATSDKPRKKWYQISAEGLTETAKSLGNIGQPVIRQIENILKSLG